MVKFIHLSDFHLRKRECRENTNLRKVVDEIVGRYHDTPKPVVLITGDLVSDGFKNQYIVAVNILKPLQQHGFTILAVPGNHDCGPRGSFCSEKSQNYFKKYILHGLMGMAHLDGKKMADLFPKVDNIDDVIFIGLDSVAGGGDDFFHFAKGEVGEKQRGRLKEIFNAMKVDNRKLNQIVVYFHHHPFDRRLGLVMEDAKEVFGVLAQEVDVVAFGHKHDAKVWNGLHDIDWVLASGKTTAPNQRDKFQFREVTVTNEGTNTVAMVSFAGNSKPSVKNRFLSRLRARRALATPAPRRFP